mmetsp:Transcript_645/g.1271  ORF Transcript_645/g.1271 Transcript_645/m.1271 type:complete len:159 (-) Transcript_645:8-484(-)
MSQNISSSCLCHHVGITYLSCEVAKLNFSISILPSLGLGCVPVKQAPSNYPSPGATPARPLTQWVPVGQASPKKMGQPHLSVGDYKGSGHSNHFFLRQLHNLVNILPIGDHQKREWGLHQDTPNTEKLPIHVPLPHRGVLGLRRITLPALLASTDLFV